MSREAGTLTNFGIEFSDPHRTSPGRATSTTGFILGLTFETLPALISLLASSVPKPTGCHTGGIA